MTVYESKVLFSNFISRSLNNYSSNINMRDIALAEHVRLQIQAQVKSEAVLEPDLEELNYQETYLEPEMHASNLVLLDTISNKKLINIDFKKLALVLVDYFWLTKFKYVNFDVTHFNSCFLNMALKKSLSKHFMDVDWNSASTWTVIFDKFQEQLPADSYNVPFKDVLINSKVVTVEEVQAWMTNERARLFSESLANADIGPNNSDNDGLDDEFR